MRRFVATLALLALLLVPAVTFADDPQIQPPIGSHCVVQPDDSFGFFDLLLLAWSIVD